MADTRLEMLPETECPGLAVAVLDVSLEISDSGRGINSTVSEKPTLERVADVDGPGVRSTGLKPGIESTATGRSGVRCSGSAGLGKIGRFGSGGTSLGLKRAGLLGALPPFVAEPVLGGCRIIDRS